MKLLFIFHSKMPTLNAVLGNTKSHFAKYAKEKKQYTDAVAMIAKATGIKLSNRVRLKFVWHLKEARNDPDNVCFAKKYILDGMVSGGMLANDGARQIQGFVDEFEYGYCDKVEVFDITGNLC